MSGRISDSTSLPEPSGPIDERFVYRLTAEGKKALEACERSNGKPAYSKARIKVYSDRWSSRAPAA
jgi:hypothetical protein